MSDEDEILSEAESYIERRNLLLKGVDPVTIRKAWFTLSHMLLAEGDHVVDMGCDDGAMTYAMAALYPKVKFTGLDKSKRQINKAKEQYKLFNLDYKVGDASSEIFEPESLDGIVNSYVLHEIFSGSRYNEEIVHDALRKQFKMLKKNGIMFIRDFARPPPEQFVLLEVPDVPSRGEELTQLSDADLLIWYAEHARPRQDPGCGGFFLEEMPQRFPGTRLFRLPYKWAYEFIMRKDDRKDWETRLPVEYTFYTERDFRVTLRGLGARIQYSAPHWDEDIINERFEGRFRLFANDGAPMGHPPTCYVAVCYKMAERKSLSIEERRPYTADKSSLKITAMRDQKSGAIVDVVSRELSLSEILPYRVDSEGYLKVYLHDGLARSIANAVPRNGVNLDGRRWSGHMIEPISVNADAFAKMEAFDVKHSVLFARDYLGLKPKPGEVLTKGPDYYPAPDYIDERIHTFFMNVEKAKGTITPKTDIYNSQKFQAKGVIREFDAQQVLDAITVGMIPNARLELQVLSLYQHLKITPQNWVAKKIDLQLNRIANPKSTAQLLKQLGEPDERFKAIKGSTGELRAIHSTFVEEGHSRGTMSGLTAENVDFIVHDGKTINTAIILPLTKNLKGEIHAGFNVKYLPIPQRYEGTGATASVPSLDIPPEITNQKQLKKFIADEYGITPAGVIKMGESYYSHIGMTPQRLYPFAIAAPPKLMKDPDTHFLPFYQMMLLQRALSKQPHFMTVLARAYRYFSDELRLDARLEAKAILKQRFENVQPEWSIPLHFESMDMLRQSVEEKMLEQQHENERLQQAEEERLRRIMEEEALRMEEMKKAAADSKHKPFHAFKKKGKGKSKRAAQFGHPAMAVPPLPGAPLPSASPSPSDEPSPEEFEEEFNEELDDEFEQELESFIDEIEDMEDELNKPILGQG